MKKTVSIEGKQFEEVSGLDLESMERFDERRLTEEFNLRFMLALDCYMTSVARSLMKDCKKILSYLALSLLKRSGLGLLSVV